ncbi:MAG TPA: TonB-dependent receptor [Pyrinomonadaceae bacterium]|nr:TonB-dependent receptor [Pyrinomonadaceae bacterium]
MSRSLIQQIVLTFAFFSLCAGHALAQTDGATLAGRVVDPQGAGVPGAIVTIYARTAPLRLNTTTDASGAYRFERLAPGDYLVEADARNFAPAPAHAVTLARGRAATLDLPLEIAGVRAEVVVTAADAPQTVDEVSKAISIVTVREMEARDEYSIPEALRTVPGLRVQQLGGPGSFTTIKTRGLRNQDTAVLVDGLRFRDPSAERGDASGYLSDLLVAGPDRVEVLRGSGSSLYGTNAIGGVINIVTDEGGAPTHGSLLAEGGSLGLFRGRAQLAGGARANRITYSAALTHLNVTRGIDGDDAARNTSGQGRVLFRLTPTATLSARLYAADAFAQLNTDPQSIANVFAPDPIVAVPISHAELRAVEAGTFNRATNVGANFIPSTNDPDASRAARFFSGALVFNQRPTDKFSYTISYQGNRHNATFTDGPAADDSPFGPAGTTTTKLQGRTHTLNARADWQLGRAQLLTGGYEFEREEFNNSNAFLEFPADDSAVQVVEHSHAFFVQDQIRLLADRLQLSASFRAQHFILQAPRFTPAATSPYAGFNFAAPPNAYTGDGSIAYLFRTTGTKLRGHVGNSYRAPSLFERFGSFFLSFGNRFSALGDPRLRPDRALAFDAGLDQTLAHNRVRASATYFYTRLQEVIDFANSTPNDPFGRFGGYVNTGGALARGAELSVAATPARTLDLNVAYTYTNADERVPRVRTTLPSYILRSFAIPAHQFSLVATQRLGQHVLLNFDLIAASNYLAPVFDPSSFVTRVFRFRGIRKADAGASYTLPLANDRALRFFGYVDNLTNYEYFENGFRTPGRTGRAGAQFNF